MNQRPVESTSRNAAWVKAVPANQSKKQPTAEEILSEVLDESANKAVEEYDAHPRQVVQQEMFEQEDNVQ
jgi:hypothetical protein